MKEIAVLDTSIASENLGDKIIMDYCGGILEELFPQAFFAAFPTHDILGPASRNKINQSDLAVVCGTNLLSSNMNQYNQWKIDMKDAKYLSDVCLLGVGWWQYQDTPNRYTQKLLKAVLDNGHLHSVRDAYTEKQLRSIGITNVVNTACPTMWKLTKEHCKQIPQAKTNTVVTTLTSYAKNPELDKKMLEILCSQYEKVVLWLQASDDRTYLQELGMENRVEILAPSLRLYDRLLQEEDIDYVGTRLHGGIRALNYKRRAIIIAVDNRAIEIGHDTGLPVIKREDIEGNLAEMIQSEFETEITLPEENIAKWKAQF